MRGRKVSVKKTKKFHKKKHLIDDIILSTIGKNEVIYGEQALRAYFPKYLERHTQDYDVYSSKPFRDARQAEHKLDKKFGGDFFYVKPAQHPGTYKVMSNVNEEGYADFTRKPPKTKYKKIHGKNYISLNIEKQHRLKSLNDPESSWRHGKDRDALNRILIFEKSKKKKGKKRQNNNNDLIIDIPSFNYFI